MKTEVTDGLTMLSVYVLLPQDVAQLQPLAHSGLDPL